MDVIQKIVYFYFASDDLNKTQLFLCSLGCPLLRLKIILFCLLFRCHFVAMLNVYCPVFIKAIISTADYVLPTTCVYLFVALIYLLSIYLVCAQVR